MMKKKMLIIIAAVSIIGIAALLALKPFSKKEAVVAFNTVKVEKGDISNTVTATGTIQALKTVNVGTQVSGIILHIYVDFNDHVKQGQLLAKLDETPLRTQLDQSQSAVDQAQSQLHFEEATYNRLKVLYDKKLIAQNDYDQALYNYENSKASLANAKSGLDRAKVNLQYATITSPIDGVVLNRAIEEGQTVAASFSTPTLFTIVNDLTQMEVQTSVDEADIGKVKNGQRVQFTVDAYSDLKFEGTVSQVRLQPVTTNNVVTYVVILNAPNPDKKLMPGMTASATIYVEEKTNTLLLSGKALRFTPDQAYMMKMFSKMKASGSIPKMPAGAPTGTSGMPQNIPTGQSVQGMSSAAAMTAMNSDPKTKTVWLKDDKMGIRPNRINIGIDNGTSVEVLSGLKEGDEVVISSGDKEVKSTSKKTDNGPPGFPF
jgi:RND family efflux transporter, MFP subunit